jgi:hypothetical protein
MDNKYLGANCELLQANDIAVLYEWLQPTMFLDQSLAQIYCEVVILMDVSKVRVVGPTTNKYPHE